MAGRASIVGAAETSVGKVRDHNEDSHFIDPEAGIFIVCDGMGGHAAGEVASALAVQTVRKTWMSESTNAVCDRWLVQGTPEARKQLLQTITQGVLSAHDAIVSEAEEDKTKKGMGTTLVGAIVVGGDIVFAHAGDSRAYMVRDGIAMQLTEDHTLLARLLAAGVDVDTDGEGMRFKSMLTNALGIGQECKVSTFVVPVADGDRFLLCSDGITEYVKEAEIGEVLTTQPSPARSAQRLVEMALQRGGGDNATALVVRVLEAGETSRPSVHIKREEQAIYACPIWGKANPQQRLRALRIALPRDYATGEKMPAQTLGDRVAWIIVEGELEQDGHLRGPGSLLYPEALLTDRPLPDKDGLAVAQSDVRALALRSDDFRELCDDDPELGEILLAALGAEISARRPQRRTGRIPVQADTDHVATDPGPVERAALGRANTGEMEPLELGRANTARLAVLDPAEAEPAPLEAAPAPAVVPPPSESLRQPRASTVPPQSVRPRSSTDVGAPKADRTPAQGPAERPSAPRLARSSTPPTGLFVNAAGKRPLEESLDLAMAQISGEHPVPPSDHSEPEIVVEGTPRALPPLPPPPLRPPAPRAIAVPKPPPPPSEPEISISALEAAAASEEAPVVVTMTVDDDEDSKVMSITADEPSEPVISVVADEPPAPAARAKSEH